MKNLTCATLVTALSLASTTVWGAISVGVNATAVGTTAVELSNGALGIAEWVNVDRSSLSGSSSVDGITFSWLTNASGYGGNQGSANTEQALFRLSWGGAGSTTSVGTFNGGNVATEVTLTGLDTWMANNGFNSYYITLYQTDNRNTNQTATWDRPIGTTYLASGASILQTWNTSDYTSFSNSQGNGTGGIVGTDGAAREIRVSTLVDTDSVSIYDMLGTNNGIAGFTITGSTTVVPEPSTYALVAGVAMLGIVAMRRRRK
ncbi:MAG: PEP-CTERM sorting domain-containing protein [Puniceicoccales bacterium]|nr:PEP-CTERM sorting domain-containing protein [Puniceicoccales bacterium]